MRRQDIKQLDIVTQKEDSLVKNMLEEYTKGMMQERRAYRKEIFAIGDEKGEQVIAAL